MKADELLWRPLKGTAERRRIEFKRIQSSDLPTGSMLSITGEKQKVKYFLLKYSRSNMNQR